MVLGCVSAFGRPGSADMHHEAAALVSKVLVLDDDERHREALKAFCQQNGLVALKAHDDPLAVLASNVDLGAILLWEHQGGPGAGRALARRIHRVRPELPLFLRREADSAALDDLVEADRRCCAAAFTVARLDLLRDAIGAALFCRVYPNALVRGITEITRAAIEGQFRNVRVEHEAPCLVKDRIIYGELFSLIPLESNWCRGFMMLQTEEQPLLDFLARQPYADGREPGFREINGLLGEATNLVWGAFKNRFILQGPEAARLTQVPIIVNHRHHYISFGSEDPQLCVKYRLSDPADPGAPGIVMYQWFAFNLAWTPDNFAEHVPSVESLCEAGELELF